MHLQQLADVEAVNAFHDLLTRAGLFISMHTWHKAWVDCWRRLFIVEIVE
jgi:hypothetical protein